jgi:hypothetical protein
MESVTELRDRLDRARSSLKRAREEGEAIMGRAVAGFAITGGAATAGLLSGLGFDKVPGTEIDADLAIGTLIGAAGVAGVAGKHSEFAVSFGAGMAAPSVKSVVRELVLKARA